MHKIVQFKKKVNQMKKLFLIFILLSLYLNAIIYEDASDGTIDKWKIFDNTPSGAFIKNIVDDKKGKVIQLSGTSLLNEFILGNLPGMENAWNNTDERVVQWSMKTNKDFLIFVSLKTQNGNRFLVYSSKDYSTGHTYGLGSESKDGKWRAYRRDLDADLKAVESNNSIVSVNGFLVRGSGLFDDIQLLNRDNLPELISPIFDNNSNSDSCKVVYEDAEDGNITGWRIYDNSPTGATIENIIDDEKGKVISLSGNGRKNGYLLGGIGSKTGWNDINRHILTWSMKTSEFFTIFVSLTTENGHRYLLYTPQNKNYRFTHGIGKEAMDGTWHSFNRNLDNDLKDVESNNSIISVNGFLVRGSGLYDDIALEKQDCLLPPPPPSLAKVNLLDGNNSNVDGTEGFSGVEYHEYVPTESHTDDGSGSFKLVGHWYYHALKTAKFHLEKGKYYTLGAYMKALGSDRGQNVIFKVSGPGGMNEMNWNISKAGQWEEIVMPYYANETGDYQISIFTYKYALTTDHKYAKYNGSNLEKNATILFDDFYVYESQSDEIVQNEPYTPKVAFESSNIKIDELGNWQIKEDGVWRDFFPKFTYQDYTPSISESAKMYSSYGFTGFTNMKSLARIKLAVANGMKYNGIQVNAIKVNSSKDTIKSTITRLNNEVSIGKLPPTAVIMYEYDNEQEGLPNYDQKKLVSDWLNANDKDPLTNKRARPINMLNGVAEGVARNYKNSTNKNYLDTVGTYITQIGHTVNQHLNPVNTLGILQKAQNQIAPVSIMQLQCHYQDVFIPSIFKGIGAGARGLNFWRAGATVPSVCKKNFEDNVWVPVIKDVFNKIDQMLPIIKEPLGTSWSATVDDPTVVSIGTRDHNGKHYIILANFAPNDLTVNIKLSGLDAKSVHDYFTQDHWADINNGEFSIKIGHHNNGFLVLELSEEPDSRPIANRAPIADAGKDKVIYLNNTRTIIGKGIDLDGRVVSYEWKDGDEILSTSASFPYTPTEEGNVTLTLTVTDNEGGTDSDTVNIENKEKSTVVKNLLAENNPNVDGTEGYIGIENHEYSSIESHTNDGSGSIKLVGHWFTHYFKTADFHLERGKHYTLGAYMKAIGSDRGQNVIFKISGAGHMTEMNWNISKANQWEEIVVPYRADMTGDYHISIFTYKYALTTDHKYARSDGSNLERNATMFFDDFYVYESEDIAPNEPYTPKVPFESSNIKIDALGNWQIKEDGVWKDFFPKFTYQDYNKISTSAKMYSSYGFTGFTNMLNISQIKTAVANGMKYNGIQVNGMNVNNQKDKTKKTIQDLQNEVAKGNLLPTAVIMYEFDNEQVLLTNYDLKESVSKWLDENDKDPLTNKRARPINMLNGTAEGVARNYKNSTNKDFVDSVSTYITQLGHATNQHSNPVNTLGILQKAQNQIAPVSIMQLQCHYQDVFIPSIFKGIGEGAKGLNFWRAGRRLPSTCKRNFEDNVWAPVIKDVFNKIDQMLPIIKEPLDTSWSATVDDPTLVSIGTRDHDGKHYIILANFGYTDLNVDINLEGLEQPSGLSVKDYFTKEELTTVSDNGYFSVTIGHHNNGFLVLELD